MDTPFRGRTVKLSPQDRQDIATERQAMLAVVDAARSWRDNEADDETCQARLSAALATYEEGQGGEHE